MHKYQREFIRFVIAEKVLTFGEFRLKSGRISPYFFNAGLFNSGRALSILGQSYAEAIKQAKFDYDVLFGPAYKGIVLATITCKALYERYSDNVNYAFNRKESKDHGEGGTLVGAPLKGRILIIDDVITAGTAICESMSIIKTHQAQAVGVIVALDRQERMTQDSPLSAIEAIEQQFTLPVVPIVTLAHILEYLETTEQHESLKQYAEAIRTYQSLYGINSSTATG